MADDRALGHEGALKGELPPGIARPVTLRMDRGGAFTTTLDTSSWPAGERPVIAVLRDGWSSASYAVGTLVVKHAP